MDPGEEVVITFDEPGVYRFYCSLHASDDGSSGMAATLVVGDVPCSAAGEDSPAEPVTEWTGVTRRVPADHPTIQNAVDAADPGDLVLISPAPETDVHRAEDGRYVYFEQVDIATPYLTIRGTDRNAVIIDGEHQRPIGINTVAANGVAVENLTVRNTTGNGVYWTAVRGYRGSYLTAVNNAIYGIYAFDSTDGLFEHSYASGSKDAGFYVGQCDPCDAILTDVTAELNGMGYSGTNASDVFMVDSVWRHNVFWMSGGNVVTDNIIEGSGYADVVLAGPALPGNCFAGNEPSRTVPAALESVAGCGPEAIAGAHAGPSDPDRGALRLPSRFHLAPTLSFVGLVAESEFGLQPVNDHRDTPHPPDHPTMPDPQAAPVVPAVDVFASYGLDVDAIEVPDAPDGLVVDQAAVSLVAGVPFGLGAFSILYGVLGWLGPFALLVAWIALALIDLAWRDDLGVGSTAGWMAVVLLVPFVGAPIYLLAGGAALPRWLRWGSVLGALLVAVALLGAAAVIGGLL